MGNKPIILTLVRHYLPGFASGGPVRTIANVVDNLSAEFAFKIVTLDRDSIESGSYPGIRANSWNVVGASEVYYAAPSLLRPLRIIQVIRETPHDVLYVNSFFDPEFSIAPLVARRLGLIPRRPTIVAPRGEFSSGALALKRQKKLTYLRASRMLRVVDDVIWQASSEYERLEIMDAVKPGNAKIVVSPNIPTYRYSGDAKEWKWPSRSSGEPLRICFLSRLTPKKNLDFALEVLKGVRSSVVMRIYGGVNDPQYFARCQELALSLPSNVRVEWCGLVPHDEVPGILSAHDLFFLPTRGENYGHAIVEALMAGVPVLISDQTPWRELKREGIGWDLPLSDVHGFREAIEYLATLSGESYAAMRNRALEFGLRVAKSGDAVEKNRKLFEDAVAVAADAKIAV